MSKSSDRKLGTLLKFSRTSLELERLESRLLLSAPMIGSLSDSPDPVHYGDTITLTAHNVTDPDVDPISRVDFYRSTDSAFDPADVLVGSDMVGTDPAGWQWQGTAGWPAGFWHYFALATDAVGEQSSPAMTTGKVNARPTIASLTGSPDAVSPGDTLTLTANGVSDPDGHVIYVEFFHDTNNNGVWDGSDRFLRRDTDSTDGWTWSGPVEWTVGDYFARASDNDGAFGPIPYTVGRVNQRPTIGALQNNPNPIFQGQYVTFIATGVMDTDSAGGVASVAFWRDVLDSGHYNPQWDDFLGYGTLVASGRWELTLVATWDPDISPLYFAIAADSPEGAESHPFWTLNQNPTFDHLEATNAVIDEQILLEAFGVADADGFIRNVAFSVWDPPQQEPGWPWPDWAGHTDRWPNTWHYDYNDDDGYTWGFLPTWSITAMTKADFDGDGDMDVAVTVDVVPELGPDLMAVLLNTGSGEFIADSLVRLGPPPVDWPFHQYDPTDIDTGDFDGDGYPDIVIANSNTDRISVLMNRYDPTATPPVVTPLFDSDTYYELNWGGTDRIYPHAVTTADYNGDGVLDIAVASYYDSDMSGALETIGYIGLGETVGAIAVLFGEDDGTGIGTGAFIIDRSYALPGPGRVPEDLVSADLDQDGDIDLAVVSRDGPLFLWNTQVDDGDDDSPIGFFGDAGGNIGRATETGITGAGLQQAVYGFQWREGTGRPSSSYYTEAPPYFHGRVFGDEVDMYRVTAEAGASLLVQVMPIPWPPGSTEDPFAADIVVYYYDSSTGYDLSAVRTVATSVMDLEDPLTWSIYVSSLPWTGNYYVGLGGQLDLSPAFNPLTGHNPGGPGSQGEYALYITAWGAMYDASDTLLRGAAVVEPFEPNPDFATATNLGTTGAWQVWYGLAIQPSGDEDWYSFTTTALGTAADLARIEFTHAAGDLALELRDNLNNVLVSMDTLTDDEQLSLSGLAAGTYYLRVYSTVGATNTYDLLLRTPGGPAGINGDLYFEDQNLDTLYDIANEDVWADGPGTMPGIYDAADTQVYDPTAWQPVPGLTAGEQGDVYFYDTNGNALWDPAEFIWCEGVDDDGEYLAGTADDVGDTPIPVAPAWGLQFAMNGIQGNVYFYDANVNGYWDPGEHVWADQGGPFGLGFYDPGTDQQIDSSPWVPDLPAGTPGMQGRVFFLDGNFNWQCDPTEGVWWDSRPVSPDSPIGSGDFIVTGNFLEDNQDDSGDREFDGMLDIDVATAETATNRLSVLHGEHYEVRVPIYGWVDYYGGLYPQQDHSGMAGSTRAWYDAGTDEPIYDASRVYYDWWPIYDSPDWDVGGVWRGSQGNVWFYDVNLNSTWDPGEDIWADQNANNIYEQGTDTQIYDTDFWDVPDGQAGIQGNVYFYDDVGGSPGAWDSGEDLWADMHTGTYITRGRPTSLTTYNIDADNFRALPPEDGGTTDWWWGQGSVEAENIEDIYTPSPIPPGPDSLPRDPYLDLVTTNDNGTLSIFLNEGGHSANFGVHEYTYGYGFRVQDGVGTFSSANYSVDDYTLTGPFDTPVAVMVDDFDGDGLQNFVVAERLNIAVLNEAYPFHSSDPLELDMYDAEAAQAGLPFDFGGRYSIIPGYHEQFTATYFARAHDDDYDWWNNPEYEGYSETVELDIAFNQKPLIWTLTANRTAISGGDLLELTANGAQDLDGFVAWVEFYHDDGVYTTGEDIWIQNLIVVALEPGVGDAGTPGLLFADVNLSLWWEPGEDIWVDANVNGLYDAGETRVYRNGDGWRTAVGAPGIEGNVRFDDLNSDGQYAVGVEGVWAEHTLLDVDTDGSDGFSFTGPHDGNPDLLYWARAIDDEGDASRTAYALVNQVPTIAALHVDGTYDLANDMSVHLTPGPGDLGIRSDVLFNDANFDRAWDYGEDLWHEDTGGGLPNGLYDWEYDIGLRAGIGVVVGNPVGTQGTYIFSDATGDGRFQWTEEIWEDTDANGRYDDGEAQIWPGVDGLWNTIDGTSGMTGNVYSSAPEMIWADSGVGTQGQYDVILEVQITDGGDSVWTTEDGTPGTQGNLLFRDDSSDRLWDAGEPIWAEEVFEYNTVVLTAVDVDRGYNSGGTEIRKVHFYRDLNYNGRFEPTLDQFLGQGVNMGDLPGFGTSDGDDWQFFVEDRDWLESPYFTSFFPVVNWSPASNTYFAVAQDFGDRWSATAEARNRVRNIRPLISGLIDSPDPVTEGAYLTLTATGVDDPFGDVDHVAFYIDANDNDTIEPDVDTLLGTDADGADGWSWTSLVTWPSGSYTYMTRVLDNYGEWSIWNGLTHTTDGDVNARPVYGGTFQDAVVHAAGDGPVALASGDFNGDDRLDLAVTNANDTTVSVFLGNGDGTFAAPVPYIVGTAPNDVLLSDLNANGYLDLIIANSGSADVSVLLGNGDGTFTDAPGSPFAAGTNPVALALGTFDADPSGYLDLAVANASAGLVNVLSGNGDGTFGSPQVLSDGDGNPYAFAGPIDIAVARFNGDSYPDLAVLNSTDDSVHILLGDGLGAFWPPLIEATGPTPSSLAVSDLDRDGFLDIAVVNSGNDTVSVLLGGGDGTFTDAPGSPLTVGADPAGIGTGLLDSDIRPDLVVTNATAGSVSVLLNNGGGRFANPINYTVGSGPAGILAADLDGDDVRDLVVANQGGNTLSVLMGIPGLADENAFGDYDPVYQGMQLILEVTGLRDPDGDAILSTEDVEFYRDADANGALDLGLDELLDPDGVRFLGMANGGRVYQWTGTVTWAVGDHMYFSRARDERGAWSYPVSETGRVANPLPVIVGGLLDDPDPVTEGYNLTLVAQNVQDANGTIELVEFYRDSNGNGALDLGGIDDWLGINDTAEGRDYSLTIEVEWGPGTHLYFALAQDNLGDWSEPASAEGFVNGRPVIETLSASPIPIPVGDTLRLEATGVSDTPPGYVVLVEFYRDSNDNNQFDEGSDELLPYPVHYDSGTGAWWTSFAVDADSRYFFARAQDDMGGWSFPAATSIVNRLPVVESLQDLPDPVTQGGILRLEAENVYDVDGWVDAVEFYRDLNDNDLLDPGTDELLGTDTTPGDGWYWTGPVVWSGGMHTYFARARDDTANWTLNEDAATTDGYVNRPPTVASMTAVPDPVTRGETLTLTAVDAVDLDGTVVELEFYRDANDSGAVDAGDVLLGTGANVGNTLGGAGDEWLLQDVSTSGWEPQTHTLLARARDNSDAWSVAASTTVRVNAPPMIGSLGDSPDPVARGETVTLTAVGVGDVDGTVMAVEFYRDSNDNQTFDPLVDDLLPGISTEVRPGEWELTADTSGWPLGLQTYFTLARDNDGAWSDVKFAQGTVHQRPVILTLTDIPDPVIKGNDLMLVADGVTDPDDPPARVVEVLFYRDADGDGVLDVAIDQELDRDTDGTDGWQTVVSTATWPGGVQTYFAVARDNDGGSSVPVSEPGFVIAVEPWVTWLDDSPDPLFRGRPLTLTATGVGDSDGFVALVEFYRDDDGDQSFDPAFDQWLDADTDGTDGWQITYNNTMTWALTSHTYFARAQDDDLAWSTEVSTTGTVVNNLPVVGSLAVDWDPVAPGQDLTLTAGNVTDFDGTVQAVEFWRDLNDNGVLDLAPDLDDPLGLGTEISPGVWELTVGTVGWPFDPDLYYFARAQDNDSDWGAAVSSSYAVNYSLIEWNWVNGKAVAFYDIDPDDGVSNPEIAWGRDQRTATTDIFVDTRSSGPYRVRGIYLYGDGTRTQDLGIVVSGNAGLAYFRDYRQLTVESPLGFLAVQGDVKSAHFANDLEGTVLDGFIALEGWVLPAELDGDHEIDDPTGFYAAGEILNLVLNGSTVGDIVAGQSIGTLKSKGPMEYDITALGGGIKRIVIEGDLTGDILAYGDIRSVTVKGGDIIGSIRAEANHWSSSIGTITARAARDRSTGLWVGGNIDLRNGRQITAGSNIKKIQSIKGSILGDGDNATKEISITDGNLGTLQATAGNIDGVAVDVGGRSTLTGHIGTVRVTRSNVGIRNSLIEADGLIKYVRVQGLPGTGGDFYNSSIQAQQLRRVSVSGRISQDASDGDVDEIHALTGRFSARDVTWRGWIEDGFSHTFSGLEAWVGEV